MKSFGYLPPSRICPKRLASFSTPLSPLLRYSPITRWLPPVIAWPGRSITMTLASSLLTIINSMFARCCCAATTSHYGSNSARAKRSKSCWPHSFMIFGMTAKTAATPFFASNAIHSTSQRRICLKRELPRANAANLRPWSWRPIPGQVCR
jgi:hypothetical protein